MTYPIIPIALTAKIFIHTPAQSLVSYSSKMRMCGEEIKRQRKIKTIATINTNVSNRQEIINFLNQPGLLFVFPDQKELYSCDRVTTKTEFPGDGTIELQMWQYLD